MTRAVLLILALAVLYFRLRGRGRR